MISLLLALALAQSPETPVEPPSAEAAPATQVVAPPPAAAPVEDRLPTGAPRDDYLFVGWCYGALRGYLDLHDQVMPEVTRIESAFRRPGTNLADDLKVYADMQKEGRGQLKLFQAALTSAEKASLRPINMQGAAAVRQGRMVWRDAAEVSKARVAQEWMSWTLPARCETIATALEARANLMGATLSANQATPPVEPAQEAVAPPVSTEGAADRPPETPAPEAAPPPPA